LKTLLAARARGGEIQTLAEARIAEVAAALADNEQKLNQARANDDALHAALMARDEESDQEIGAVCDEMWNALGRPSRSVDYDIIAKCRQAIPFSRPARYACERAADRSWRI
jgi:hypothetical protein